MRLSETKPPLAALDASVANVARIEPVPLDVRGTLCWTSTQTLAKAEGALSEGCRDGSAGLRPRFVDCDSLALRHALYHARTGVMPPDLDATESDILSMEAEFLGMPQLQHEAQVQKARAVYAKDPSSTAAKFLLEHALMQNEAYAEADALQADDEEICRASFLWKRSRMQDAYTQICDRHASLDALAPAAAYLGKARGLLRSVDGGGNAVTLLLKATALVPNNPFAWLLLGRAYKAYAFQCGPNLYRDAFDRAMALGLPAESVAQAEKAASYDQSYISEEASFHAREAGDDK